MLRLKELRTQKNLTQAQFAKELNVAQNTVSNWENGNRAIDVETLQRLAYFFNVSVDYLLGGTDVPQQASQEKSTANGGLEENLVVYCRNGKTKKLKLSAEKMKLFEKMLDAIKDEDVDL